jgi:hypothetical protein
MSLNAWEQQALESIQNGLAASDPELTALLSTFNLLASDEEMPDSEKLRTGWRTARRWLRRARWGRGLLRACQHLGLQRAVMLLSALATAALIAVMVALSFDGDHATCTQIVAMACVGPAPGHSPASPSYQTTTAQHPAKAGP